MLTAAIEEVSHGKMQQKDRREVPRDSYIYLTLYKLAVPCIKLCRDNTLNVGLGIFP